jgi:hypothetical protein
MACNPKALTAEERARWKHLIERLGPLCQEVRELPDGYGFRFPAEKAVVEDVVEFIGYERVCCAFFDVEIKLARNGGPFWLHLTGDLGVKEFLRAEFGIRQPGLDPR